MEDIKKINEHLRILRLEKGMSQKELAKMVGITQYTVSNIERGARSYSLRVFIKILKALETPVLDFFVDMNFVNEKEEALRKHREQIIKGILDKRNE